MINSVTNKNKEISSQNLNERLDFNIEWEDIKTMDSIFMDYIEDRTLSYTSLFTEDYVSSKDIQEYLHYFLGDILLDNNESLKIHPYLPRLKRFLNRNYEVFTSPTIEPIIQNLKSLVSKSYLIDILQNSGYTSIESLEGNLLFEEISNIEYDNIEILKETWDKLVIELANFPLLNLDKMVYREIEGVQVYCDNDTPQDVFNAFKTAITNISKVFPNTLLRIDSFLLLNPKYIELIAGEGTKAYFLEDSIFYSNSFYQDSTNGEGLSNFEKQEEITFTLQCFYHEFAHFIFSLLSETYINYWIDSYEEWCQNNIKMTRNEDRNSQLDEFCEELFCDTFACMFVDTPNENYYIHNPSSIITDTVSFILRQEFEGL